MPPKYPKSSRPSTPPVTHDRVHSARSDDALKTTSASQHASSPHAPPRVLPPRGRLLFVDDVINEVFQGRVSAWWVRRNVAPAQKLVLGHSTIAWYEDDVWNWIHSRQVDSESANETVEGQ
jgi:hypothetical protein